MAETETHKWTFERAFLGGVFGEGAVAGTCPECFCLVKYDNESAEKHLAAMHPDTFEEYQTARAKSRSEQAKTVGDQFVEEQGG